MIEVNNLTVRYGKTTAVSNVGFTVERGEVVAILGPNGAGKSSIMKSIVGIVDFEGEIKIDGMNANTKVAKNLFGYVPEEIRLIDHLTPEEFFSFLVSVRKLGEEAAKRVEKYVRIFRLEEQMDKPIISLSMGNKKKVAVVAALLHDPPYLLLDEPLNGLDAFSARVLKEVMARKTESGGILLSTHIMEIAERLADRVIILNRGLKIAEGTLEELKSYGTLEEAFLKITGQHESLEEVISAL
ncbi:ABC transporter ATP-binding protein [Archaeoglobus fulgidus]|uniref:ABC transporter, ATP-binding protein n=3 Tax=Archaeoglobus fulgidus TaxID=2234 RepID=O29854_ARCFU|nr:ABC transporter ATP-binding protein [Archaeoglobus fulgidus]AAB90840.1 ABC transporter, ATP-binding protein [Archaeoglobus fulgidus DSM 4304]AIG97213.1 ABC-type multidrug transport system, ATPase component [Archaeoglobus fulgidus DSM 8774]KUJ94367.1 MAG: ABC transporter, ATP-binding protein [Archaeoglobus fulgidus]KUK05775.1 MAG: ABC transporter, ATP-binding protein [Archaeoglobus fulgidus]